MDFEELAQAYEQLERTTRQAPTFEVLSRLFKRSTPEEAGVIAHLTLGKLGPDWLGLELGLAEKSLMPLVAQLAGSSLDAVASSLRRTGDLGTTAEEFLRRRKREPDRLGLLEVHRTLTEISRMAGTGSAARKADRFASLLHRASALEARYLVRIATGKLRLGAGESTIRAALSRAFGVAPQALERAYAVCSDLGLLASAAARGGSQAVTAIRAQPGRPLRPMLAQRLGEPRQILDRLGGQLAAEYKYDGERIQVHRTSSSIELFSRRIERITDQYPDVVERAKSCVRAREAIIDVEVVAVDPKSGRLQPFQVLMQRRRKYRVKEMVAQIPVSAFAFDLLYLDGADLLDTPYLERRRRLEQVVHPAPGFELARWRLVRSERQLEEFFAEALDAGLEGLVCKDVRPSAVYHAGARGWQWVKLKREYRTALADTFDLVVVGAFYGRGSRAGTYGSLLLAAYEPAANAFRTVTRVGSGFIAEELARLPEQLEPLRTRRADPRVDSRMKADVWFRPERVIEVLGSELTLSPTHTAGMDVFRPGAGLAIRFPRFTGRWRPDKRPEDATTVDELIEMYRRTSGAGKPPPEAVAPA